MNLKVQRWWMQKNFKPPELDAIEISGIEPEVLEDSEKAFSLVWHTKFGDIQKWVPKSLCLSEEELETKLQQHFEKKAKGLDKYSRLYEWAKQQGIPVNKGMKMQTLSARIEAAGLELPEEFRNEDCAIVYRSKGFPCPDAYYPVFLMWDKNSRTVTAYVDDAMAEACQYDGAERDRASAWCDAFACAARNIKAANQAAEEYGVYFTE